MNLGKLVGSTLEFRKIAVSHDNMELKCQILVSKLYIGYHNTVIVSLIFIFQGFQYV